VSEEPTVMQETEQDILKAAADGKEHRFGYFENELMRRIGSTKGKYAKATIIKYLNILIDDGLMEVKPGSREQRFRPVYRITEKGILSVLTNGIIVIRRNLEGLETLIACLLSNSEILDEWRETTRAVIRGIAMTEGLSFEQKVQLTQKERDIQFSIFRKVLRDMHQISLRLFASPHRMKAIGSDVYLHVNEDGVISVLSEDEPIKHPDIKVIDI
jgi:DNA-binding PadR family transcriptional regulator